MKVVLSTHFQAYAGNADAVDARGRTVGEVLADLDARFPGIRFRLVDEQDRIRPHVNVFVNDEPTRRLAAKVREQDVVSILGALSGG